MKLIGLRIIKAAPAVILGCFLLLLACADEEEPLIPLLHVNITDPTPADGGENIPPQSPFSWEATTNEGPAVDCVYYLGLGTSPSALTEVYADRNIGFQPPLGTIRPRTKYYWQITAVRDRQVVGKGPVWSFTSGDNFCPWLPATAGKTWEYDKGEYISRQGGPWEETHTPFSITVSEMKHYNGPIYDGFVLNGQEYGVAGTRLYYLYYGEWRPVLGGGAGHAATTLLFGPGWDTLDATAPADTITLSGRWTEHWEWANVTEVYQRDVGVVSSEEYFSSQTGGVSVITRYTLVRTIDPGTRPKVIAGPGNVNRNPSSPKTRISNP